MDDTSYNLFVLKEIILSINPSIEVQTANNGKECLDIVMAPENIKNNNSTKFDLIFLDLHMPIMDGFQTVYQLREKHKAKLLDLASTPIIAVSAITKI